MKKPFDFIQSAGNFAVALILVTAGIYFLRPTFPVFPSYIHAWTQSDRYALALGFLDNGFDFFHPKTFNLATVDGITRVDFPIHEYIIALLMGVTGVHEPIVFRIYTFIYAVIGLVFLFRLSKLFSDSPLRNFFVVMFIFLCPVYLYYMDGFLPTIPSLSNAFIGYYFFFKYKKFSEKKDFAWSVFFLTLAELARLPFIIFLFAVACQQLVEYFKQKKISKTEIKVMAIAFAVFISYQCYNIWLGNKYGTQFLMQILPASSLHQMKEWISETLSNWKFEYFTISQYFILGILLSILFIEIVRKKIHVRSNPLLIHVCIAFTGSVIYFFLMLQQFPDHDYYFIDAFFPPIALLMIFLVSSNHQNKIIGNIILIGITFFMYRGIAQATSTLHRRYEIHEWDRVEITRNNFIGTDKFLDSLGISKNAKVLVLDGYTTNIPLILMNRKGWTVNWTTEMNIREGLSQPYDFVAIQNAFSASDVVRNYPGIISELKKFADNGLVSFYRKEKSMQSLDQFLGIDSTTLLYKSVPKNITIDASTEYYDLFQGKASDYSSGRPVKLLVTGKIQCGETKPRLIASMSDTGSTYYYFLYELDDYIKQRTWQPLLFQFVVPSEDHRLATLKAYLWNNKKVSYSLKDVQVQVYR